MTTAYEVIVLALKDAGVLADAETPDANMAADAFSTLQQMLAMWQTDKLYVNAMQEDFFAADGSMTYTVGSGGDVNIPRPESVDFAFWRLNGVDYPIRVLRSFEQWEAIGLKQQDGVPIAIYYNPTVTLGTLYVYPQPTDGSLFLTSKIRLPSLGTTASSIVLPDEYIPAIRFSLAEMLLVMFNTPQNPGLVALASRSRRMLKRNNARVPELQLPMANSIGYYGNFMGGV